MSKEEVGVALIETTADAGDYYPDDAEYCGDDSNCGDSHEDEVEDMFKGYPFINTMSPRDQDTVKSLLYAANYSLPRAADAAWRVVWLVKRQRERILDMARRADGHSSLIDRVMGERTALQTRVDELERLLEAAQSAPADSGELKRLEGLAGRQTQALAIAAGTYDDLEVTVTSMVDRMARLKVPFKVLQALRPETGEDFDNLSLEIDSLVGGLLERRQALADVLAADPQ